MKQVKIALSTLFLLFVCSAFVFGKGHKPLYAFGLSTSFTDSVVYYTDIQALDSVKLDKNKFLPQREAYSYQLKNYLEMEKGTPDRTCMIYFSPSKKSLIKELDKLINRYKRSKTVTLQLIKNEEFRFIKPEE